MHCYNCGHNLGVGARYCPRCGINLRKRLWIQFFRTKTGRLALAVITFTLVFGSLFLIFRASLFPAKYSSQDLSTAEIEKISQIIPDVICGDISNDPTEIVGGSGSYLKINKNYTHTNFDVTLVVTNGHVADTSLTPRVCRATFHNQDSINTVWLAYDTDTSLELDNKDIAALHLDKSKNENFPNAIKPLVVGKKGMLSCDRAALKVGEKITVFGYPSSGENEEQRNLVVTQGIISNIQSEYIYTTAQIDTGNSGGLAVSKINGRICVVGIPTWVSVGEAQILGVIQPFENLMNSSFNWNKFE